MHINRTKFLRGDEKRLFVSYIEPHKCVSKDTIGRWVKVVTQQAGVDPRLFQPHSTRAAATTVVKPTFVMYDLHLLLRQVVGGVTVLSKKFTISLLTRARTLVMLS